MGRCKNEVLLRKINIPKLTKEQSEVSFTILRDLDNCRRVITKDEVTEIDGAYNKFLVPKNQFECLGEGCFNSGTFVTAASASPYLAKFFAKFDMTELAGGALTFYFYDPNKAAHTSVIFTISSDSAGTNADRYTFTITEAMYDDEGFVPIIIDLMETPAGEIGTGWTPAVTGAYVGVSTDTNFGVSTIAFYDSIEDFASIDVVKVGCLSSVGGTLDPSLIESACNKAKYNDQMGGLSFNVTGRSATPNYWKLNPMAGKGKAAKGFTIATVEKTITSDTHKVTLADLYHDECRFVSVQLKTACDAWETELTQLYAPKGIFTLDENQYLVNKKADGTTDILFSADLAGQEVLISYPREADVDEIVIGTEFLNGVHVSMAVPVCEQDRVMRMLVFNNVYITSFPYSLSENDTDFSFSINIQPDREGYYFHNYKVL